LRILAVNSPTTVQVHTIPHNILDFQKLVVANHLAHVHSKTFETSSGAEYTFMQRRRPAAGFVFAVESRTDALLCFKARWSTCVICT
jgi:hypothetical protein